MNEDIKQKFETKFPGMITDFKSPRQGRIYMRVENKAFKDILKFASGNLGFAHLSTLTGVDLGTKFEVLYHLFGNRTVLSIAISADHDDPRIDTVTDIIPGALVHEREIQDLLGIKVNNIPDGRRLIIPEDWPQGQYPLRKDWNVNMLPDSFNDGLLRNWKE